MALRVQMTIRMNYIISYDISEDGIRKKVADELLQAGCRRLQKSVFMAVDFNIKELRRMKSTVLTLMATVTAPANSIICLPVSKKQKIEMWWQPPSSDPLPEKEWSVWV